MVEEKEIRKRKHLKGEHEGCGECEEKTRTHYYLRREWHEHKGQQDGKEESRERYKERGEGSNVLEESLCTLKLHENIADPSHADIFNPRAGRLRAINSLTLPVLKLLRLSAQWVKLYKVTQIYYQMLLASCCYLFLQSYIYIYSNCIRTTLTTTITAFF